MTVAGFVIKPSALLSILQSSAPIRYSAAVGIGLLGIAARLALDPLFETRLPFITLFPAVMISAWIGGLGTGLVTTATCLLAADYLWLSPVYSFRASSAAEMLGLALFGIIGVAVSVLQESWRRNAVAVAQSQERLDVTLASIGDAVIVTDAEDRITMLNTVAQTLTGWTAGRALGRRLDEVCVVVDEASREIRPVSQWDSSDDAKGLRNWLLVSRDDRHVPVEIQLSPLRATGGKTLGTLAVVRDMTDRREAERVRDEEDRAARMLAAIVESSDDAIVSKNLQSEVLSWNSAAERMFGYTADEMIGQSVRRIIPEDRMSEEDEVLRRLRLGERVDHFETIRRRKDGQEILVSLTISPVRDRTGRVIGASKIARDITSLKEVDAERVRLARENAAVTEQLNRVGAIVVSDLNRDSVVQAVTDAATELTDAEFGAFFYGIADEATEERTLWAVCGAPKDAFAVAPVTRDAALFEQSGVARIDDISLRAPARDLLGPALTSQLSVRSYLAVPVVGRSGDVLGGLILGHTLAERFTEQHERLAAGLASWAAVALENAGMYIQVRDASRLKDHFLATLSHELRTPLNAILGYARMLRSGMVPAEKRARAIEVIERNATSLTQIVEDVLDVSRIVSGKLRLNMQSVELPDVVRTAVDAILPAAEAKGVRVEALLDPEAAPISGDPERLQQVLWNLLSNAVKFTGRGGRIEIRLARADEDAEITVTDTGIGIAREFLPHIFERFRQADAGPTRERGGLGLGLSIARQLVEMHGGTIHAFSEGVGRGTTFQAKLPLINASPSGSVGWPAAAAAEPPAMRTPIADLSGVSVLSVDDEPDARQLIGEILETAGARVVTASSAMEALELLERECPDAIVADVGMPHMDGFQFIDRVRHHHNPRVRSVPAAALTAFARSEDRGTAMRAGFQRHLPKPIDPSELVTTIAEMCRQGASVK
ncbi:MAG TPA: PAS domain S-box protein [Vicinamibacterales bacterium]